jgi:hypothetical protein
MLKRQVYDLPLFLYSDTDFEDYAVIFALTVKSAGNHPKQLLAST